MIHQANIVETKDSSATAVHSNACGTVYCVAGGTGGHVFPAVAVADALCARGYTVQLITDQRGKKYLAAHKHRIVNAAGLVGQNWWRRGLGLCKLAIGLVQSLYWVGRDRPVLIIGFGGYASLPVLLAGQIWHRRTVVHEQNALMGRVNRLLSPRAERVMLSFAHTLRVPAGVTSVVTGNPILLETASSTPSPSRVADKKVLLVIGGSLGAKIFDRLVPAAVALLPEHLRHGLCVWQQVSSGQEQAIQKAYAAMGVAAECRAFFPVAVKWMAQADVMVCRAGAGTCAEIVQTRLPSIMVPLARAADNHQWHNAKQLVQHGAACLLKEKTLNPALLASSLEGLLEDHAQQASTMRAILTKLGQHDPLTQVLEVITPLLPAMRAHEKTMEL